MRRIAAALLLLWGCSQALAWKNIQLSGCAMEVPQDVVEVEGGWSNPKGTSMLRLNRVDGFMPLESYVRMASKGVASHGALQPVQNLQVDGKRALLLWAQEKKGVAFLLAAETRPKYTLLLGRLRGTSKDMQHLLESIRFSPP